MGTGFLGHIGHIVTLRAGLERKAEVEPAKNLFMGVTIALDLRAILVAAQLTDLAQVKIAQTFTKIA
jgi:hypothetical protein